MNRETFLEKLRTGLRGLPQTTVDEVMADYEAHFSEGLQAGRTEDEIASALGDPSRLARELRTEAGIRRWELERNPSAAAGAIFAILGLGVIDIVILLPILLPVAAMVISVGIFTGGAIIFVAGPFAGMGHYIAAIMFGGLSLMAGGVSLGALAALVSIGFVNGLVWFGRLHMRLLKPVLESSEVRP
ncbi:MAG: hypothetical protein RLZZ141_226 [Pseudomonadota bacterium]